MTTRTIRFLSRFLTLVPSVLLLALTACGAMAQANPLTWISVKYAANAGWSGPEFLGYTSISDSDSFDGPANNGVNSAIGLTGAATAAWNLNLYSFASNGPGGNLGALFSNIGYHYSAPDSQLRHFNYDLDAEVVFKIDKAGIFKVYQLTEALAPFNPITLESGVITGGQFLMQSTLVAPLSAATEVYVAPGTYRFRFRMNAALDSGTEFHLGNGTVFQVLETELRNQPPVATDDYYVTDQASSLSVPAPGVQANDADPDEDVLTASIAVGPSHATSFQLNADGSFTYTPQPYFYGTDTFTYKVNDGSEDSNVATVSISVAQPGAGGFITGGGKYFDSGRKCTFGFVAKVLNGGVQGNLEYQDHDSGLNVKSTAVLWVYAPNATDGYFSGTCTVNGSSGCTFFVQVHDRGEPGRNDDFTVWVFDANNSLVSTSGGTLASGGNIQIHG